MLRGETPSFDETRSKGKTQTRYSECQTTEVQKIANQVTRVSLFVDVSRHTETSQEIP